MTPYEMWYGKIPPSPFPFLKPGFVKRKRGNKLEPKAVPCFYIGPSPNRPRDSMRVMLRSGAMIDSRHINWACIPSLTPVLDYPVGSMIGREKGGSKTAELLSEEVEPAEVESDASGKDQVDARSEGNDSKPVNVQVDCEESEDEDEELYIFPQCAPAPAPAAAPKERTTQVPSLAPAATSEERAASPAPLTTADVFGGSAKPATVVSVNEGSEPAEFEGSEVSSGPSVGHEGSDRVLNEDAQESPVPSTRGTETGEPIPPPVLGGREAAKLKWTTEGPTGNVEDRTRGDVRRLQAPHGVALVARGMGMEAACEDSVFRMALDSYVGTLSDLEDKFLIEGAADIAFQMETQEIANFLDGFESAGKPDGTFFSVFETAIGSEFVCLRVCDDVALRQARNLVWLLSRISLSGT